MSRQPFPSPQGSGKKARGNSNGESTSPQASAASSGLSFPTAWSLAYRELGSNAPLSDVLNRMLRMNLSSQAKADVAEERGKRALLLQLPAGQVNQQYDEELGAPPAVPKAKQLSAPDRALQVQKTVLEDYTKACEDVNVLSWETPYVEGPLLICMYAEKGGVGKTSTTVSLAWTLAAAGKRVLLVDCDNQRSLSKWILDEELKKTPGDTLSEYVKRGGQSHEAHAAVQNDYNKRVAVWQAANPGKKPNPGNLPADLQLPLYTLHDQLVDSRLRGGAARPGVPFPISGRPNVWLHAGHSQVHDSDKHIHLSEALTEKSMAVVIETGAPLHSILATARSIGADVVLLDLNPISSTLNRCLVMASHYLIIPGLPDFSTQEMLDEMRDILPRWKEEWDRVRDRADNGVHPLPPRCPKFLGYILSRHNARRYGFMRNGITTDLLAVNEKEWLVRVEQAGDRLQEALLPFNLSLPRGAYMEAQRPVCIGMVRDWHQLGDLSGHFHLPVHFLSKSQMVKLKRDRRTGAPVVESADRNERENMFNRVTMYFLMFKIMADTIFKLINQDGLLSEPNDTAQIPPAASSSAVPQSAKTSHAYATRFAALENLQKSMPEFHQLQLAIAASLQVDSQKNQLSVLQQLARVNGCALRPDSLTRGPAATDGSCMLLALVDQERLSQGIDSLTDARQVGQKRNQVGECMNRARNLRFLAVEYIKKHPDLMATVVGSVDRYLRDEEWGDHTLLVAVIEVLRAATPGAGLRVELFSSGLNRVEKIGSLDPAARVYRIGHIYESHYRSLKVSPLPSVASASVATASVTESEDDDADMSVAAETIFQEEEEDFDH